MAFFTIACAFHDTPKLLEYTLPLAIKSLTVPTKHEFEIVLVAERSTDDIVSKLLPKIHDFGIDELRFRCTNNHSFSGAPSNNFHCNHFKTTNPYLLTFTDDTFIFKTNPEFDVLDSIVNIFNNHPEVSIISKVDDHEEWDNPLTDNGPEIESGIRSVNRVVDQLIAYDTSRFFPIAQKLGAWNRDTYVSAVGFEYQWENLASHVGTTGGRKIAYPGVWPLRVRHCDLRNQPGSMHGTQNEEVKLKCFEELLKSEGLKKE